MYIGSLIFCFSAVLWLGCSPTDGSSPSVCQPVRQQQQKLEMLYTRKSILNIKEWISPIAYGIFKIILWHCILFVMFVCFMIWTVALPCYSTTYLYHAILSSYEYIVFAALFRFVLCINAFPFHLLFSVYRTLFLLTLSTPLLIHIQAMK